MRGEEWRKGEAIEGEGRGVKEMGGAGATHANAMPCAQHNPILVINNCQELQEHL